ncbi:hypothetical protein NHX12_028932 [Muraenolepis orangiensis]|uniref:DUF4200 domain-containing protein n=1 Tax=Muraenolepis orangiensis TaxID=630683 RepID=A0A9Q0ECC3_9TELE|nr:hypothetical protein NHX12_028932 [Muraenolepis orangiensis]
MDLEDYLRATREGLLGLRLPTERYVTTGATQMLEKRKENAEAGEQLRAQIEVFQLARKSLRRRRDGVVLKEETLRESLLNFDTFLQENSAKCSRGIKKDRRRQRLQLSVQRSALYWRFLELVLRTAKFEEVRELVGRFKTLLATKTQLGQRESRAQENLDSHRRTRQRDLDRQNCLLMHNNNLLSELQTQLDYVRAEALGWDIKWTHIQNTAAKETLLLGQIKTVTLNLFHTTGGQVGQDQGVEIHDTETQLDRIQIFIQKQTSIVNEINPSDNVLD